MTVWNLISNAYNLKRYQMPADSFDADRYEITATIAAGTTREQFREMLKNLLKERFQLAVHFEKKEVPGYELVVAKGGLKMKEAQPPKDSPTMPGPRAATARCSATTPAFRSSRLARTAWPSWAARRDGCRRSAPWIASPTRWSIR